MNQDEAEGRKENIKGRVKEAAGVLTGDEDLESEGARERSRGALLEKKGRFRRTLGDAIEDFGKHVKK
jgi:uncharacterized protein YjbJ (UPF0337 family)